MSGSTSSDRPRSLVDVVVRRGAEPERPIFHAIDSTCRVSRTVTGASLAEEAGRVASHLAARFATKSRIVLSASDPIEFLHTFVGSILAGLIPVPAAPLRDGVSARRLGVQLEDCEGSALVLSSDELARTKDCVPRSVDLIDYADLREGAAPREPWPCKPDDVAFIQYTSGSTRDPRGVVVTHRSLLANLRSIHTAFGHDRDSVLVTWLPSFHDMGLVGGLLQPLFAGMRAYVSTPSAFLTRPSMWLEAISRFGATTSGAPNFAYEMCVRRVPRSLKEELDLSSWRVAFNGAEPVRASTLRRFAEAFAPAGFDRDAFFPCYGLAESTLFVSGGPVGESVTIERLDRAELGEGKARLAPRGEVEVVGCGKTWGEPCCTIVDPAQRTPVPDGTVGEVWVTGASVAGGYWCREGEPDPAFGHELPTHPDEKFLRTGDLGYMRNGELFITGRIKDILLVRGRNVYPQDVETELANLSFCRGVAAAFMLSGEDFDERLVVALEVRRPRATEDWAARSSQARETVFRRLGIFAERVVLVRPGALPRTTSGKIMRAECRRRYEDGTLDPLWDDIRARPDASATSASDVVLELLRHLVGAEAAADVHGRTLTDLGLDSMHLASLVAECEARGVRLPENRAIYGITVEGLLRGSRRVIAEAAPAADLGETAATYLQESAFVQSRLDPESSVQNLSISFRVAPAPGYSALSNALAELVSRHSALRTVLHEDEGRVVAQIVAHAAPRVELLHHDDPDGVTDELRAIADRPFDLGRAPLLRAAMHVCPSDEVVVQVVVHHSAVDLTAAAILWNELWTLIDGGTLSEKRAAPGHGARQRARTERSEASWSAGRTPALSARGARLPGRGDRRRRGRAGVVPFRIGTNTSEAVRDLARKEGVTPFVVLFSAFQASVHLHVGAPSIETVTPFHGRDDPRLRNEVGCFVELLRVGSDVVHGTTFRGLLRTTAERLRSALADTYASLGAPSRVRGRPASFGFSLYRAPTDGELDFGRLALQGHAVEFTHRGRTFVRVESPGRELETDLLMTCARDGAEWLISLEHDLGEMDGEMALVFAEHFRSSLAAWTSEPDRAVAPAACLAPGEVERVERAAQGSPVDLSGPWLIERVRERAATHPTSVALETSQGVVTYAELLLQVESVATALEDRSVGPGVRVAVAVDRSALPIVAALAVWEVGASYVPFDVDDPAERSLAALRSVVPAFLLRPGQNGLPNWTASPVLDLRRLVDTIPRAPVRSRTRRDDSPAYILHTSGSSGVPKGVLLPYSGLRIVLHAQALFRLDSSDRVLQHATAAFDASIFEVLLALGSGATLVVLPRRRELTETLGEFVRSRSVTTAVLPPTVAAELDPESCGPTLRTLIFAGEVCSRSLVDRWLSRCRVYNAYGPTEASIWSTLERVTEPHFRPTIGRPIPGVIVRILDDDMAPAPVGVPGNIVIEGRGVGLGYIGASDRDRARFIDAPGDPGRRRYVTGDRGRWLADGSIEYLGRRDAQVKVRGVRIELEEIQAQSREVCGVNSAAAVVVPAPDATAMLAVVYTAVAGEDLQPREFRSRLLRRLPASMVPTRCIRVDAMPRSSTGKVDLASVREIASSPWPVDSEQPVSKEEEEIARIWCEVLGVPLIGPNDDVHALGGHSLVVTRLAARMGSYFGRAVSVQTLYEHPTIRLLTSWMRESSPPTPAVAWELPAEGLALSPLQNGLWFLHQVRRQSDAYHVPLVATLRGALCPDRLEASFRAVIARHPGLTMRVVVRDDGVHQAVTDRSPAWTFVRHLDDPRPDDAFDEEVRRFVRRPFDLQHEPPVRAILHRTAPDEYVLAIVAHHMFFDGWSASVFCRELGELYRAGGSDDASGADDGYVAYLTSERDESSARAFWSEQLGGREIPMLDPCSDGSVGVGRISRDIAPDAFLRLSQLAAGTRPSVFSYMLAAAHALIARHTSSQAAVLTTVSADRDRFPRAVGYLASAVPVALDLPPSITFEEMAGVVHTKIREAALHSGWSLADILRFAGMRSRGSDDSPALAVLFVQDDALFSELSIEGVEVEPHSAEPLDPKAGLIFSVRLSRAGARLSLEFDRTQCDPGFAELLVRHYVQLLTSLVLDPTAPWSRVPMATEVEFDQIRDWNCTTTRTSDALLHELVEEQARTHPDAEALRFEGTSLTYSELDARASRLAAELVRAGASPRTCVSVAVPASVDLVVAQFAILKVGAAWLPLDSDDPDVRIASQLAAAAVELIVTDRESARWEALGLRVVEPASDCARLDARVNIPATAAAYVLFTSGSTGTPKGAINTHRGIVNRICWMQETFGLTEGERVLFKTSFTFDVSVWEEFWPLCFGATVVIARHRGRLDLAYIEDLIRRENVSTTHFVPSVLAAHLNRPECGQLPGLKRIIASGEALSPDVRRLAQTRWPARLHNLYGPTEAAIDVSHWACAEGEVRRPIPIGSPIANVSLWVLDQSRRVLELGVPGELYIGGIGVGAGYIGDEERTRERFVPDPFSAEAGARLFRTGDRARWREDGVVEFLGRLDEQVKVRGVRIEPGEVEHALAEGAVVSECVVRTWGDGVAVSLVAWCVPSVETPRDPSTLRARLSERLPQTMIPSRYVFLDEMPRLPSGKIDHAALPPPDATTDHRTERASPRDETERRLLAIWHELIGDTRAGTRDHFFDAGGHSLLFLELRGRVRRAFGVDAPLVLFLEHPTVEQFCERVLARAPEPTSVPAPPTRDRSASRRLTALRRRRSSLRSKDAHE